MPVPSPVLFPSEELFPSDVQSGQFTQGVLTSFAPWLARDPNGVLNNLLVAFASMFEPVATLVMDSGSPDDPANYQAGWSLLLDVDNCPAQFISYGAAFCGVQIPPGTPESEARAIWRSESGFQRGTPASIISAAKRNLTGTQSVTLLERTPTPYSFTLVVRPEECANPAAMEAAVLAVKPAGIVAHFVFTDGWTLFQMEATYGTITALEAAFATITGIEQDQVGH